MIAPLPDFTARAMAVTLFLALLLPAMAGDTNEFTISARLFWGTNDKFSPNTNHTAAGPELTARLKKCLKWENYFLVTEKNTKVGKGSIESVKMSEHCTLEIINVGGDHPTQIRLIGDGKQWGNTNFLAAGQDLILGGDAANNTAWIIYLRSGSKDVNAVKDAKSGGSGGKPETQKPKDKEKSEPKPKAPCAEDEEDSESGN